MSARQKFTPQQISALRHVHRRRHQPKGISAMVRVRNEEEFLYPAIRSIVDHVEEIAIFDNRSDDRTPEISRQLATEYPRKVCLHEYPHRLRKIGHEYWVHSRRADQLSSCNLSANFYNWCLARCSQPYILKWDGDMLACQVFYEGLQAWRRSRAQILVIYGVNVHPDKRHLLAAKRSSREELTAELSVPGMPSWVTWLTYDFPEPRLFSRHQAHYDSSLGWTQKLRSPFLDEPLTARYVQVLEKHSFLHLKFLKSDPLAAYSQDLADLIRANVTRGPLLDEQDWNLLARWQIA